LIFVGNFFLINLFLGVINYTFDKVMLENESGDQRGSIDSSQDEPPASRPPANAKPKPARAGRRAKAGRGLAHDDSAVNILDCADLPPGTPALDSPKRRTPAPLTDPPVCDEKAVTDKELHEEPVRTVIANTESGPGCVRLSARMLVNPYFSILKLLATLVNTISLAMIRYPEKQIETKVMFYLNIMLTLFFLFENIVLLVGEGIRNYFKEVFPVFDLLLSIISKIHLNCRFG
jgi:hypothetical protein